MARILLLFVWTILLQISFVWLNAQKVQGCLSSLIRLSVDNDFLNYRGTGSDRYYTNGANIAWYQKQKKPDFISSHILIMIPDNSLNIINCELTQLMFTPVDIGRNDIIYNDRPYAGTLFMTRGLTSVGRSGNMAIHSEISVGIIGPLSFADHVQTWIHKIINYQRPEGWSNQVKTDIVFNYNIDLIKEVFQAGKFQANYLLSVKMGTLYNDINTGIDFRAGKFQKSFFSIRHEEIGMATKREKNSEVFFFGSGRLQWVLGNALLQGGIIHSFKNDCADFYHIKEGDVKRLLFLYEIGMAINMGRCGFRFSQNFISSEFTGADTQLFGRISVLYKLN